MGWGLTCTFLCLFLTVTRVRDSPIPSPLLVTAVPLRLRSLDGAVVGDVAVAMGARRGCCRNGWAVVRKRVGVSKMGGRLEHVWAVGSGLTQVRVFGACRRPCWGSSTPVTWQPCAVRFGVQEERGEGGGWGNSPGLCAVGGCHCCRRRRRWWLMTMGGWWWWCERKLVT